MLANRPVGRDAATKKYDILTALAAYGLSRDKGVQRLVLRLMVLVTARYNWRRDELSMGRKEIARIWAVEERTVKREMAKLRNLGWVNVKVPAARGRVAVYSIDFDLILGATEGNWPSVGPDFVARMGDMQQPGEGQGGDVVPFTGGNRAPPDVSDGTVWATASVVLFEQNAPLFGAWFKALKLHKVRDGYVRLEAPSKFHAHYVETHFQGMILAALRTADPGIRDVGIEV